MNDISTSQPSLFEDYNPNIGFEDNKIQTSSSENLSIYPAQVETVVTKTTDIRILDIPSENNQILNQKSQKEDVLSPELFVSNIDKEEVTKFINDEALLTYVVRSVKITSYLKSLTSLVTLLTHSDIDRSAIGTVTKDVVEMIYVFAEKLRVNGEYEKKA